ncbi:MAG: tetratricopeptide repeat protein [Acidobacteriota bacterium]
MNQQAETTLKFLSKAFRCLTALLVLSVTAAAQQTGGGGNTPGRNSGGSVASHTIRGKVFLPSGNLPDQRIRVVLEVTTGGIAAEIFSDSVGNFEFRGLANGSYRVSVPTDNHTYETTQETVEVFSNMTRTFSVQVYLKEKSADPNLKPNNKLISAADLQDIPKAAKKAYEQGVKLARENKPQDASAKLQEALKIFPDYLYALNKLGEQCLAMNKSAEAQAAFERAIAINPKFALPHINLGILYVRQKQYAEAIPLLEVGNRQDDSYPMGHLNLGLALMSKTQPELDRAEKELTRALEMGKKDMVYVRKYLFNLNMRRQSMDKAAEQLEAYLKEAPDAPDAPDVRQMLSKMKKTMAQQKEQAKQQP